MGRQEVITNEQARKELQDRARFVVNAENFKDGALINRPVTTSVRTRAGDVIETLAGAVGCSPNDNNELIRRVFNRAKDNKITVSEMLEIIDPSDYYAGTPEGELDAFDRQLMVAGIRVKSDPAKGIFADKVERFETSNNPGSVVLYPEFINRQLRANLIAPDILSTLVNVTTTITGRDYRTIYLDNSDPKTRRMYRVAEGAEIPKTKLVTSERGITLYKYGRGIEGSYEAIRRTQIDKFAIFAQQVGMQSRLDRASAALNVLVNGDGNSNSATNYNQSSLDTGSTPTYNAFLAFAMNFYPYKLRILLGNAASLIKFLAMAKPSVDPFTVLALLEQRNTPSTMVDLPQNFFGGLSLLMHPDIPDGLFIGIGTDPNGNGVALEEVVEAGSTIVEPERLVSSQREALYMSEIVGYAKILDGSVKTWTWNA
jgi:hypothetical protein